MNGFPNIRYTKICEAQCIPMRKPADIILGTVRCGLKCVKTFLYLQLLQIIKIQRTYVIGPPK